MKKSYYIVIYLDMDLQASCTENKEIYSKGLLDVRNKYREN